MSASHSAAILSRVHSAIRRTLHIKNVDGRGDWRQQHKARTRRWGGSCADDNTGGGAHDVCEEISSQLREHSMSAAYDTAVRHEQSSDEIRYSSRTATLAKTIDENKTPECYTENETNVVGHQMVKTDRK